MLFVLLNFTNKEIGAIIFIDQKRYAPLTLKQQRMFILYNKLMKSSQVQTIHFSAPKVDSIEMFQV